MSPTDLGVIAVAVVVGVIATRERRSWNQLRETRPVKLLIAALEPPEPPDQDEPRPSADTKGDGPRTSKTSTETKGDGTTEADDVTNH